MLSPSREVITLQCGHYANFVGAHWWNLLLAELANSKHDSSRLGNSEASLKKMVTRRRRCDEGDDGQASTSLETNSEIYFHCRHSADPTKLDSFTPRLVSVDFRDCLSSLAQSGDGASEADSSPASWQGQCQVTRRDAPAGQQSWPALMKASVHSKSLLVLPSSAAASAVADQHLEAADLEQDAELWPVSGGQLIEQLEDRIRFFSEACDSLQGFHLLTTVHDGFSQLCEKTLNYLADDFAKKALILVPTSPAHLPLPQSRPMAGVQRLVNWARLLPVAWQESSLVVPLTLSAQSMWQAPRSMAHSAAPLSCPVVDIPGLTYNAQSHLETSAVLAAALDSALLPCRLSQAAFSPQLTLLELCDLASKYLKLNELVFTVAHADMIKPRVSDDLATTWTSLTPTGRKLVREPLLSRCATLRGVETLLGQGDADSVQQLRLLTDTSAGDVAHVRRGLLGAMAPRLATGLLDASLPLCDSFVRRTTTIVGAPAACTLPVVDRQPTVTSLVSSGGHVGDFVDALHAGCQSLSSRRPGQVLVPESVEWAENLEWLLDRSQHARSLKL